MKVVHHLLSTHIWATSSYWIAYTQQKFTLTDPFIMYVYCELLVGHNETRFNELISLDKYVYLPGLIWPISITTLTLYTTVLTNTWLAWPYTSSIYINNKKLVFRQNYNTYLYLNVISLVYNKYTYVRRCFVTESRVAI